MKNGGVFKLKRIIFLLVAVLLLTLCIPAFAEGTNLIQNPGFEDGSPDDAYFWLNHSWDTKPGSSEFKVDTTQVHSGSRSVRIVNTSANDSRYEQQVKAKPNSYYKLSCWIKTQNVGTDNKGANLSVENLLDTSKDLKGTNAAWEYVELYGKTGPDQQSFNVTLGLGGYGSLNTGTAWFDDMAVEEVPSVPSDRTAINLFQGSNTSSNTSSGSSKTTLIIIGLLFAAFLGALGYFMMKGKKAAATIGDSGKTALEPGTPGTPSTPAPAKVWFKIDGKDVAIMAAMTVIYLAIALVNLGSFNVPKTQWKPVRPGESFVMDLGKERDLSRIYYYSAYGEAKYRVEYKDDTGKFVPLTSIDQSDFYIWKYINISAKTSQLKFIADSTGGFLNELGVFESQSQIPVSGIKIIDKNVDPGDIGSVDNLFDEQNMIEYRPTFMTGTYFDEIYHVRTAYEHMHRLEPYENTHPPLGKLTIALGILIFGMNTFGWRIMGTLFGAAMIPAMYVFGKKLFDKRFYGFCAAFLMMFDFMHFVQTRIGTIDVYGTFWVILMYYFMYDYYMNKSYHLGFTKSLKPLFLSGLFFGIGAASKWIGIYAGGGLALLFFLSRYQEYKDYAKLVHKKSKKPEWVKNFMPLYMNGTLLYCILFFIIIPAGIYLASYIPFMMVPGPGHGLKDVVAAQINMYNYHKNLVATHSFSSPWYEWPFDWKPMWFYGGSDLPAGKASSIVSMGNPAIWWAGIFAFVASILIAFKKNDRKMTVVFVAAAFQYFPWVAISRITFIYHYFSTVPFMILAIVYVIKYLMENYPETRYTIYAYLGVVALLFIMFYPIMSGMMVDRSYVDTYLRWFKTHWIFM